MTNTPGDYDIYSQNPESLTGIYMSAAMEAQCHIFAENLRNQYETKTNQYK